MFARTDRLLLRPAWPEDAQALQAAIGDEAVIRNLAEAPWPYGLGDAHRFVTLPGDAGQIDFLIFSRTRAAPRLVGGISLMRADGDAAARELGFWIARPYWGLGFATEAARAVIAMADDALRLPRLTAGHFVDNPASGHVLRKLGFRPTGDVVQRLSRGRGYPVATATYTREGATAVLAEGEAIAA